MNVLVISHLFPTPAEPHSGVFVVEQMKALRELGVNPVPLCPTPFAPAVLRFIPRVRDLATVPKNAEIEGFSVRYPRVLAPGGRFFAAYGWLQYLSYRTLIGRLLQQHRIDLIHAHTVMPSGFAAALLSREHEVPSVVTMHGSDVRDYPHEGRGIPTATRWALRHSRHLIGVSREIAAQARALSSITGSISVIHNGADHNLFRPYDKSAARAKLNIPQNKKIVLFVGSLEWIKGVDVLIRACASLRPSLRDRIFIYLVGSGSQNDSLRGLAANLGIFHQVRFTGQQPYQVIPYWLSAADCLVLSSRGEGLPTILPEAMLCHVPVIASAVGGIPEIIRNRETGLLVQSNHVPMLASSLAETLDSEPSEIVAIADRAQRFARINLTWSANAQKTLVVYNEAIRSLPMAARTSKTSFGTRAA